MEMSKALAREKRAKGDMLLQLNTKDDEIRKLKADIDAMTSKHSEAAWKVHYYKREMKRVENYAERLKNTLSSIDCAMELASRKDDAKEIHSSYESYLRGEIGASLSLPKGPIRTMKQHVEECRLG